MKQLFLLCILLSLGHPNQVLAQNFEGTITYKIDFEVLPDAAKMGVTKSMLMEKMNESNVWADTEKITYKGGFYRDERMSKTKTWDIYRNDSNKIYTFQDSSDLCEILNASIDMEANAMHVEPTVTLSDTIINVYNKRCRTVHVQWKSGYFDYTFSDGFLPMDPGLYKYHTYNGWNNYLKIAKSLPLQFKTVLNNMIIVTYTAISIKESKIDEGIFKIPALIPDTTGIPVPPNETIMMLKK